MVGRKAMPAELERTLIEGETHSQYLSIVFVTFPSKRGQFQNRQPNSTYRIKPEWQLWRFILGYGPLWGRIWGTHFETVHGGTTITHRVTPASPTVGKWHVNGEKHKTEFNLWPNFSLISWSYKCAPYSFCPFVWRQHFIHTLCTCYYCFEKTFCPKTVKGL